MPTDTAHTTSTEWIVSNKRKRNNYKDTSSHRNLKKKIITPHVESYEEYKKRSQLEINIKLILINGYMIF